MTNMSTHLNGNSGNVTGTFTLNEQNEQRFEYEKTFGYTQFLLMFPNINRDLAAFKTQVINTFNFAYSQKKQKVLSESSFLKNKFRKNRVILINI